MQDLEQDNKVSRAQREALDPVLDLKLPRVAEFSLIAAPIEPEPKQKPAAPAWAKALAADGNIEQQTPRLTADARNALAKLFEESPVFFGQRDQSLKNHTETQRALVKALKIPDGEAVVMLQEGNYHALGLKPQVTIKTQDATLVANVNGYFKFKAESNQMVAGTALDHFRENAQGLAERLKESPAELLLLQRGKPLSEGFSKRLSSRLQRSIAAKPFADTELSAAYDRRKDCVELTLERKSKEGDSVVALITIPFSEFEKRETPVAHVEVSRNLSALLLAKDASIIDQGLHSICPAGIPYNVLVPKPMSANSLPLYGCEWKGDTISRYDATTKKTEVIHKLKDDQTAVFRFDSALPGLRATIVDGKNQEVTSFSFKR